MTEEYESPYLDQPSREKSAAKKRESQNTNDAKDANPILKVLKGIWFVLLLPFRLLINIAHILNEVRMLVLSIVTIAVVLIVSLVIVVVFKPAFAWEPLKNFLNADIKVEQVEDLATDNVLAKRMPIVTASEIKLSQAEVTRLFRASGFINQQSVIWIHKDNLQFVLNIDDKDKPLWLLVTATKNSDGNIKISEVAFKRLVLPGFIAGIANSSFSSITDMLAKQNGKDSAVILFNQLSGSAIAKEGWLLSKVDFIDGFAVLKYSLIVE
jgi:hypothetical protein